MITNPKIADLKPLRDPGMYAEYNHRARKLYKYLLMCTLGKREVWLWQKRS